MNPWDDEDITPHDLDQCACRHSRDMHNGEVCWACYVITPQILAPAYPWHAFHLVRPWLTPVQTSSAAADYTPPRGWDRPAVNRQ
ncbi:hypothetical protein HOU95_gp119 [Streptomyces phage Hiyaa]|jgi:hypothetical protein|uniref:Uncharacterized protein n=1 Tax=Streptomyces phage Hiyaa TaxID=2499072 RepID=A0A3S9U8T7_9CAUD|nr:hypothetical protein HOU95_gp119 [Streptomyces phage Hiyaa]AZS06688.1 hypothetical protein SEA_HIYAA_49 [Streptomyces phage Hiyaa]